MKVLVKIGGSLLDDADSRASLARQLASVAETGTGLTIVHGGGKQITRFLEERGIHSRFAGGLRVTTEETIDALLKVLAGTVNTQLVGALAVAGAMAVGLTGLDGGLAVAEPLDSELGFVGRVTGSNPALLNTLTGAGYVPVVACIASGRDGQIFNVNGDAMAVAVASNWQVDQLVFLTDVPGVLDAQKQMIEVLTPDCCRDLIAAGTATGGMQAKLNAAVGAVTAGVKEVRIVRGSDENIVLRALAKEQVGTRIVMKI